MALLVHYPRLEPGELETALRRALGPGITLIGGPERALSRALEAAQAEDLAAAQILVEGRPTQEQIEALPNLQAVVIPWAGVPTPTRDLLLAHPHLALHNLHHNAAPAAEHAMGLLLAVVRRLVPADRGLRAQDWTLRYEPPQSPLLAGSSAVILGAGAIGQRIAKACAGFEMQTMLVGRTPRQGVHGIDELPQLLPKAQTLFVALPATPSTHQLLGADNLALLPRGAVLVNVGRADVIDEEALYQSLASGHLGGAGLDVWYRYPKDNADRQNTAPSSFPFHELDSVVLSPHRAGASAETPRLRAHALAELLNQAAQGSPIPGLVDVPLGY